MTDDPFANFPGGNPFGPDGPFGPKGPFGPNSPFGKDPFAAFDAWFKEMGMDPKDFRNMVDEMQKGLQDALRELGKDPSSNFVTGFNFRMGPDGKPHVSSFGNKPRLDAAEGVKVQDREPLTDVIEDDRTVSITMELPGVEKKDIDVHVTEEALEVSVDTEQRKYHKRVRMPTKVDPKTTKATFKNGILDVTVTKVAGDAGVRVAVE